MVLPWQFLLSQSELSKLETENPVAIILKCYGKNFIIRSEKKIELKISMPLYLKDKIKTGPSSFIELIFDTGVMLRIEEKSDVEIKNLVLTGSEIPNVYDTNITLLMNSGGILIDAETIKEKYKLKSLHIFTPTATVSIRETLFYISVSEDNITNIAVFEGLVDSYVGFVEEDRVETENFKKVSLTKNQQTSISNETTSPPISELSFYMKEYRDTTVKKFKNRLSQYRKKN